MSGDEMERHLSLSLGEPEQLRRDMTPASDRNLYVGDATPGSFGGDEQMKVPPDSMFPQLDDVARLPLDQVHRSSIIFQCSLTLLRADVSGPNICIVSCFKAMQATKRH